MKRENLIKAGDVENRVDAIAKTEERKGAAIGLHALKRLDEKGKAGAIDVAYLGHVNKQARHFLREKGGERLAYFRRTLEIHFTFEREDARLSW